MKSQHKMKSGLRLNVVVRQSTSIFQLLACTTSKKKKHKRKKATLAVLKYYKVDENGRISCLGWEHPLNDCAAGVFTASHIDRH